VTQSADTGRRRALAPRKAVSRHIAFARAIFNRRIGVEAVPRQTIFRHPQRERSIAQARGQNHGASERAHERRNATPKIVSATSTRAA